MIFYNALLNEHKQGKELKKREGLPLLTAPYPHTDCCFFGPPDAGVTFFTRTDEIHI